MFKLCVLVCSLLILNPTWADVINYTGLGPNYGTYEPNLNRQTINSYNKVATRYRNNRRPCLNCNSYGYNHLPSKSLSALEKYSMNKTFKRENDINRLVRLEELAFGAEQYGDIAPRFKNVERAILSRPKYQTKNSVLNNIANYFAGQATGFTPSLNSTYANSFNDSFYPTYSPSQGIRNHRFEQYSNGLFGSRYGFTDGNFGNGSSIRILD